MRLRPDQLSAHLQKHGLAPVYLVSGDEPLQMLETLDLIRARAREEAAERSILAVEKGFDWNRLAQEGANLSLFSSKRLIELRIGSHMPGKEGAAALVEYAAQTASSENILLIQMDKLDKRTQQGRWFKALDKAGVIIQIWPVEMARLPGWITQRAGLMGKRIDREAAALIAERTEGNLLAARQELDKLCLLVTENEITLAHVQSGITDSTRHNLFDLMEHALNGNVSRVAGMLRGLRQEGVEPIGLYGAVMWEFRRLCSISAGIAGGMPEARVFAEYRIWEKRQHALRAALRRFSHRQLNSMLAEAVIIDKALKGAVKDNPWELLEKFLFQIAGVRLQSAVNT